jgi:CheY-like chemotaxis protein
VAVAEPSEMSDTLLLADDSVTMQRVVELTFAEQGLKVVSVSDGQQAIDYITRQRPALTLVSVTLPKVNGFDVARFVRDHVESRVPVLLLAGAFDNLDEAQVRASGASGVLVKPFEPAVVIKRVKELLGMKSEPPRATPTRSPESSGRMLTSSEGPTRTPSPAPPSSGAAPAAALEKPEPEHTDGADYLDHLDAAFDSLDAQLAGRPAPAGRATNPPPAPSMPAALDPGRRAAPPQTTSDAEATARDERPSTAAHEGEPNPVFEVDKNWFDKKPTASESLGDLTEFVVTRASDFPTPQPAPADNEDRSWLPASAREATSPASYGGATPTSGVEGTASNYEQAAPEEAPTTVPLDVAAAPHTPVAPSAPDAPSASGASASAREITGELRRDVAVPASGREGAPSPTPADAFAVLWAQEQGEPVPPPAPPPPVDLSEASIDALTAQLTDRVSARVGAPLAERLTDDLTVRLTNGIADRLVGAVADRLTSQLPGPVTAGVSERIGAGVAERVSASVAGVADQVVAGVTDRLGERLSHELTGRVVNELAPRVTQELAPRIANDLVPRLTEELSGRLVDQLVARLGPPLLERLTESLGERLSAGLADRVAELVAERALQGALGESLRNTVRDVAERVVRAEIERIRAAADSLRS